jgi:sulfotransferase family protein
LASYPRSGNTWVRFLLEAITGERCGSRYADRIMPRAAEGLVIKTHALDSACYSRAIHLVRNPFDAIESHFHWKREIAGDRTTQWEDHVERGIEAWRAHTEHWLAAPGDCHRLRYEVLHAEPAHAVREILIWLGRPVSDAAVDVGVAAGSLAKMRDLHPTLGARFFRRGQVGASYSAFTLRQTRAVVDRLEPLLCYLGYEAAVARFR